MAKLQSSYLVGKASRLGWQSFFLLGWQSFTWLPEVVGKMAIEIKAMAWWGDVFCAGEPKFKTIPIGAWRLCGLTLCLPINASLNHFQKGHCQ